jgi:hypothetical protein
MKTDANGKRDEAETIPVTVVQNKSKNGLRTLQLHRRSKFSAQPNLESTSYQIPLVEASEPVSCTEVARKYIMECEKVTSNHSKKHSEKVSPSRFVAEEVTKISCEAAGELSKLRSTPGIFEQSFNYRYRDYPIYGAFSRVQLDDDCKLMGLTVVSPVDKTFQGLELALEMDSREVLEKVKDLAGYDKVPEQWSKEPSIKWFFDSHSSKWRLSYIVEGVLKRNSKREGEKVFGQFSLRVVNYIIDAKNGDLITEIPVSR